jgi:DNA polymerase-1
LEYKWNNFKNKKKGNMKNIPLIIDSSSLLHRAKNTTGMQLSYNDVASGVVFGFMWQMFKLAKNYETMNFIFCMDSKKSKRKEIFPEYKAKRKREKTDEEREFDDFCYKEFSSVYKYLKAMGFNNTRKIKGYEADDLIASFVLNNDLKDAIIVSGDHDLYQLLPYCKGMLSLATGKLYSTANFIIDYNISPKQWGKVMCFSGCSGDGVPGIPGIGPKTAIEFLKGELTSGKKHDVIIEAIAKKDILELTEKLVKLPFPTTPKLKVKKNEFNFDAFLELCQTYSFNTFTNNPKNYLDWKSLFEGTYTNEP